ncbi:hypothetical protein KJ835_03570 [Patescibacteria group bacterium]|nr:hypothetical protein [Patescibacteria group bacterium]MBU1954257.1 hypothetical protein [Patescibacteria group bacterium]
MQRKLVFLMLGAFLLAGCRSVPEGDAVAPLQGGALPVPSSTGPSGPPGVKGPLSPPPGSDASVAPQSVTEVETASYKLP